MNISREAQDDYGIESYRRTEAAIRDGVFESEIVPVKAGKSLVTTDEEVGRCDFDKFRQTRTYWGDTVGVGSSSKVIVMIILRYFIIIICISWLMEQQQH